MNLNLIRNAREELHRTVQLISYFPRNLIDHDPTDASASLMWNDGIQGFETQSVNGVKVGLNLLEQSLLIMREGKISISITTIEKSFDQGFALLSNCESKKFFNTVIRANCCTEITH